MGLGVEKRGGESRNVGGLTRGGVHTEPHVILNTSVWIVAVEAIVVSCTNKKDKEKS